MGLLLGTPCSHWLASSLPAPCGAEDSTLNALLSLARREEKKAEKTGPNLHFTFQRHSSSCISGHLNSEGAGLILADRLRQNIWQASCLFRAGKEELLAKLKTSFLLVSRCPSQVYDKHE